MKIRSAFLALFLVLPVLAVVGAGEAASANSAIPPDAIQVSNFQQLIAAVHALTNSPKGGTVILKRGRYIGTQTLLLNRTLGKAQPGGNGTINVWAEPGKEVVLDFSALRDIDTPGSAGVPPASIDNTSGQGITIPRPQTRDPRPQITSGQGITITGDEYHLKGLTVEKAGHNGIFIAGSRNLIENCVTRYNGYIGLQIGLSRGVTNPGNFASDNFILNCDSYRNFDPYSVRADTGKPAPGNDADGFGCKSNPGQGNRFEGCRAWENADDGWDFYKSNMGVEVVNCWSWHQGDPKVFTGEYDRANGHPKDTNLFDLNKLHLKAEGATVAQYMSNWGGNGNGFKLGGANSQGRHTVKNCIAFDHNYGQKGQKGFDENDNREKIVIIGCTAFNNKKNYYFPYASGMVQPSASSTNRVAELYASSTNRVAELYAAGLFVFTNNIGFGGEIGDDLGQFRDKIIVPSAEKQKQIADAVGKAARAPRKPDGSLPDLFIRR